MESISRGLGRVQEGFQARLKELPFLRRDYRDIASEIKSRVLPTGNRVFYWNRFVVVTLSDSSTLPAPSKHSAHPTHATHATHATQATVDLTPVRANSGDIDQLCDRFPEKRDQFLRRLAEGERCYVIHSGDRVTAALWAIVARTKYWACGGRLLFLASRQPSVWFHDLFIENRANQTEQIYIFMRELRSVMGLGKTMTIYGELPAHPDDLLRTYESLGFSALNEVWLISTLGINSFLVRDQDGRVSLQTPQGNGNSRP